MTKIFELSYHNKSVYGHIWETQTDGETDGRHTDKRMDNVIHVGLFKRGLKKLRCKNVFYYFHCFL